MITGTCHCGQTGWTLSNRPETATACNCTICRRYGVLWAYGHLEGTITVTGDTATYTREDGGEIRFGFCPSCGCVTHYIAVAQDGDGRRLAAVNLRMADPELVKDIHLTRFDGHLSWKRLPDDGRTVEDIWF